LNRLLEGHYTTILKKESKVNSKNRESIVNHIVNRLLVIKWDSLKRHLVDPTKIVISKFAFGLFFTIFAICYLISEENPKSVNG